MKKKLTPEQLADYAEVLTEYEHDPVSFVLDMFPWGEGELKGQAPQEWQLNLLTATASEKAQP